MHRLKVKKETLLKLTLHLDKVNGGVPNQLEDKLGSYWQECLRQYSKSYWQEC